MAIPHPSAVITPQIILEQSFDELVPAPTPNGAHTPNGPAAAGAPAAVAVADAPSSGPVPAPTRPDPPAGPTDPQEFVVLRQGPVLISDKRIVLRPSSCYATAHLVGVYRVEHQESGTGAVAVTLLGLICSGIGLSAMYSPGVALGLPVLLLGVGFIAWGVHMFRQLGAEHEAVFSFASGEKLSVRDRDGVFITRLTTAAVTAILRRG